MKKNNKISLEEALSTLYTNYFCYLYPCYETDSSIWCVAEGCGFDTEGNVVSLGRVVASGKTWQEAYTEAIERLKKEDFGGNTN